MLIFLGKWYKFNDASVSETTYYKMKDDILTFSGNMEYRPSPYML